VYDATQATEKKSLRAELMKARWHNNVAINFTEYSLSVH
jgi:hypothetical protein